jgi:hypothetical protein
MGAGRRSERDVRAELDPDRWRKTKQNKTNESNRSKSNQIK